MIARHIIFAGLFATAAFAHAGTVPASTVTVQPAWTVDAGAIAGPAGKQAASFAMLGGPGGSWSAQSRKGDVGSSSIMLFSQTGSSLSTASAAPAAPVFAAAFAAPAATAAAAAPATLSSIAAPAPTDMAAAVVASTVLAADVSSANAAPPSTLAAADVPEPATGMLMLAGLLGAGFMTRRRK